MSRLRVAKRPFNIHAVLRRTRPEVKRFADAAMFDLAAQGHTSPFHQLVACIISVRTRDEVSLPTAIRLFEAAQTAEAISGMSIAKIAALIRPSSFYETKAYLPRCSACPVLEYCRQVGVTEHR